MRRLLAATVLSFLLGGLLLAAAPPAAAQEDTLAKIKRTGAMTIGFRESSPPFSFLAGNDPKPQGYSIDLCLRIVDGIKKELALPQLDVKWVKVTPETRIASVANGTVDIECGSTTNNLARQQQVDFSYSFYVTGGRLLASKASGIKEIEDLKGKVVGVAPGTSNEKVLKEWLEKLKIETRVVSVRDHAEGMLALETGRIDAYAHDEVGAYSILSKSTQKDKFHVVGRLLSFDPYGLMVRRDDSAFKFTVNRTLAMIFRSGEVYPMYKKHFDPFSIPMTEAVDWNFKLNAMPD